MGDTENDTDIDGVRHRDRNYCIRALAAVFPNICLQYLETVAVRFHFSPDDAIGYILDHPESEQPKQTVGKRKRDNNEQDDLEERLRKDRRLYTSDDRKQPSENGPKARTMIAGDFPTVPMKVVREFLSENKHSLYSAYLALDKTIKQTDKPLSSWKQKTKVSSLAPEYDEKNFVDTIRSTDHQQDMELMEELKAARLAVRQANLKRQRETEALEAEKRNFDEAQAKGETKDCECCFDETPCNRLVHCDGENTHNFCIPCARRNAETQVGLSNYKLKCLSIEGCPAGFSFKERKKFLVDSLASVLDRIEQDENLRQAGLPNLARCPFCSYAEEYPSVTEDKEFRCRRPDCMITSCRLCNLETHIPKTCEEVAGAKLDLRRQVEEAMSEALIRKCNKCTPPNDNFDCNGFLWLISFDRQCTFCQRIWL
ncbi:hypothetical protein FPOAC1_008416 [Fusarium poae]|uniref:hypothetical protein n=1 Tax=Fusarium poae TaxID=36050 RepID=UPI001CE8376F|nr:hypothetical protein FPOAC1_008416 [Fusarium poae]KAG8669029.1 hypothetical protein FPOAC1_008416 [Fusarium poae]